MSIPIYQVSIVSLVRAMQNLKNILGTGAKHAEENSIEPAVLSHSRLFPDMLPLCRQVHIATDLCGRCAARLAGLKLPRDDDTEEDFIELIQRVDKCIAYLEQIKPEQLEEVADKEIKFRGGGATRKSSAQDYLLVFILPNVYFHITTTYNILRHCGVKLGKKDYTGDI